jgi:replicative DNA helicase Mcm
MEDFERSCRSAFDAEPVRHPSDQRNGVMTTQLHGKEYLQTVLDAGMKLDVYDGKCLPEAVTRGGSDTKAAFVRALADSDGSVGERCVKIHSSSYDLLLGVKMLLTEFGITS